MSPCLHRDFALLQVLIGLAAQSLHARPEPRVTRRSLQLVRGRCLRIRINLVAAISSQVDDWQDLLLISMEQDAISALE